MIFWALIRSSGGVFAILRTFGIGLQRNTPVASLKTVLWIVGVEESIVF